VIIKNALPPEHHESLLAAVGQARAESIATGQNTETEMTHAAAFSPANSLQHSPPVTKLLTNERILAKVVDLLGFNVKWRWFLDLRAVRLPNPQKHHHFRYAATISM